MPDAAEFGPVPLLLGVVGHRHIDMASPKLRRVVRELLLSFRERYPCTRIVLLSALAEGADRLVAREALDAGFSLVVPLPLPVEEYEKDFATPKSVAEFRGLLARAEASFIVPSPDGAAFRVRDDSYANCGAYIARRSVELVALWDGKESPRGGTADIVNFQLDGIPEPYVTERQAFDPSVCGPVLHVATPRESDPSEAFSVNVRYPRNAVIDPAEAFSRAKFDIERFNCDVVRGAFASRARGLPVREQAGELAGAYQRRTTSSLLVISALVFFALVAFNAYTIFPNHPLAYLLAYIAFSAAAFVPYVMSSRREWQLRYQDYRALEQALRTQEYWHMAGIRKSVASSFAHSERTKVDWIAIALRALTEPFGPGSSVSEEDASGNLKTIYEDWILDQQRYFTQFAGRRERVRERVASQIITACVALSIGLTVGTHLGTSFGIFKDAVSVLLLLATSLAVGAALVHNFAEKRGWSEHARHYELMAALFTDAATRLSHPASLARIRALLITVGDEAIRETVAWLNLHRSRPLNVPRV
jgi:hypothetical protein